MPFPYLTSSPAEVRRFLEQDLPEMLMDPGAYDRDPILDAFAETATAIRCSTGLSSEDAMILAERQVEARVGPVEWSRYLNRQDVTRKRKAAGKRQTETRRQIRQRERTTYRLTTSN